MFANLIFVDPIREVSAIVSRKSPIAAQFSETNAVEFLGDIIECAFRNPSDPHNKSHVLVTEFLEKWHFQDDEPVKVFPDTNFPTPQMVQDALNSGQTLRDLSIQQIFLGVSRLAKLEVPITQEQASHVRLANILHGALPNSVGTASHSWLPNSVYIGQNRSITHTIRLLQSFSNLIKERQGRLLLRKGFFGPEWRGFNAPVSRIQLDMDELLMGDIMPSLINMCYEGMMSWELPFQDELLTGFAQIKTFVKHPERPVSWGLAFTVHSILTSIFEVQGSNNFGLLAKTAQTSFDRYIWQLEWARINSSTVIPQRPPIWDSNIKSLQAL